jgi:hypothetical protein
MEHREARTRKAHHGALEIGDGNPTLPQTERAIDMVRVLLEPP